MHERQAALRGEHRRAKSRRAGATEQFEQCVRENVFGVGCSVHNRSRFTQNAARRNIHGISSQSRCDVIRRSQRLLPFFFTLHSAIVHASLFHFLSHCLVFLAHLAAQLQTKNEGEEEEDENGTSLPHFSQHPASNCCLRCCPFVCLFFLQEAESEARPAWTPRGQFAPVVSAVPKSVEHL